ncbi:hypothetical protein D3C73_922250 [compost metagenome]
MHQRQQRRCRFRLHHRRAVQFNVDIQFHIRPHRAQFTHAAQHVFGGAHVRHAEVHHAAAQRRHRIRDRAARNRAHADRDAAVVVGHRFQRQHLVRHFADRAAALFVLHAGVRRAALHVQVQHARALARRHALAAVRAGWLADQRVLRVGGKAFDVHAGRMAARFFIRHHQEVHRQLRRARTRHAGQRRQCQVDARLHVITARAVETVAINTHRVFKQRAHRVHRVHVRQDQDAGARVAGRAVGGVQQWARGGAQRRQFHRQARGGRVVGDDARHGGDAFGKVRRRFALQPALNAGDDLFSALGVGHGGFGISNEKGRSDQATCWPARRASSASSGILPSNHRLAQTADMARPSWPMPGTTCSVQPNGTPRRSASCLPKS